MTLIHILDNQTDQILDDIPQKCVPFNVHRQSLKDYQETFEFEVLAGESFSQHLAKRNRLIIPGEFGELREFIIFEAVENRMTRNIEVYSWASYLEDLKKAKVIKAHKTEPETAQQHVNIALAGTGWTPGNITYAGIRTITFENNTNPFGYLKRVAREFELELDFRVEIENGKITRYVDLVERLGEYRGREVVLGKDLLSLTRKENTADIVTALWVYGPEREDGTRLEVFVEDLDALARWGRNGQHLVGEYEPQSTDENMTIERLTQLGRAELEKRINAIVEYEGGIADLENVPGLEHEQIRFADTIRIKDESYSPALYLEARIHTQERDIFVKSNKKVELGDYVEFTEEEVKALFNQMKAEIRRRLERLVLVSIISSAGNIFKNAQGSTQLTAKTFLSGNEVDEDGTKYEYRWHKFDKNGDYDAGFYEEGKTITVNASDIDEKASFRVEIILDDEVLTIHEITLTNVFDGEDGEQGPPGEDGKTFYTWIKYADTPTSGMSDNPEGKEYIGIAYNKETPTPSTNYSDYVWSKFKGEQGVPGPPGEDGQPTYTWVKYADDENGNGMSDSPDGKLYIGLAFNKTTPQESDNPADYTWSLMPQNIEIGGRNLLREGMFLNLIPSSSGQFTTYSTGRGFYIPVTSGEVYSLSRSAATNDRFRYCFSVEEPASGVEWSNMNTHDSKLKVENIVVPEGANYLFVYIRYQTGDIPKIKLEKGNKATDWTPAPEDVQAEISAVEQYASAIDQKADSISATVSSLQTTVGEHGTQISQAQTDIQVIAGQVATKAEASEVTELGTKVTTVEQNLSALEGVVETKVDDGEARSIFLQEASSFTFSAEQINFDGHVFGENATFNGNIEGASIKSNTTIDVTTDLRVGNNIYLGDQDSQDEKVISFNELTKIRGYDTLLDISTSFMNISAVEIELTVGTQYNSITHRFYTGGATLKGHLSSDEISIRNQEGPPRLHFEVPGRINDSQIYWNATASNDLGLYYRVNGNYVGRMTSNGDWESQRNIISGNNLIISAGQSMNIGASSFVRITDKNGWADSNTVYKPLYAAEFNPVSLAKYKRDIEPWKGKGLDVVNQAVVHQYYMYNDTEHLKYGFIIGEEYSTPVELISSTGEAIDLYKSVAIGYKAIQELFDEFQVLKTENESLKIRVEELEKGRAV